MKDLYLYIAEDGVWCLITASGEDSADHTAAAALSAPIWRSAWLGRFSPEVFEALCNTRDYAGLIEGS